MAIEAITQLNSETSKPQEIPCYTLRDIEISSAIVVPDDDEGVEILLTLRFAIRKSTASADHGLDQWYHFTILSVCSQDWKENANGLIGMNVRNSGRESISPPIFPSHASSKSWNSRFRELGFDFGPTFQNSVIIQHDGKSNAATANIVIKQECGKMVGESRYALHPVCIDGCLQVFPVAIYAGKLGDVVHGEIPTHFDEVTIWPPIASHMGRADAHLYCWASKHSTRVFVCNAQLTANDGTLLANFVNVRSLSYEAALPQRLQSSSRHEPYMQLEWKADIDYVGSLRDDDTFLNLSMASLIDLLVHKTASLSILCLDFHVVLELLKMNPSLNITLAGDSNAVLQKYKDELEELHATKLSQIDISQAALPRKDPNQSTYDLIILAGQSDVEIQVLRNMRKLLAPNGRLLSMGLNGERRNWHHDLRVAGFSGVDQMFVDSSTSCFNLLSTTIDKRTTPMIDDAQSDHVDREILLVYRKLQTPIINFLMDNWAKRGWTVRSCPFTHTNYQAPEQIIMLGDLEAPLLATLENDELNSLQDLVEKASSIIWVTPGGLLRGQNPKYGLVSGFARVIKAEKYNLDLVTLDFHPDTTSDARLIALLEDILRRQGYRGMNGETEYCIDNDTVHIGRLTPCNDINRKFASSQGHTESVTLRKDLSVEGILRQGKITLQSFERSLARAGSLGSLDVEVRIMAVDLNYEDNLILSGMNDANDFTHEIAGIVTSVGSDVSHLDVGDRVAGFALSVFATYQKTSARLVHRIKGHDTYQQMASLPMAFATALYGLQNLARVEEGENVLIVDGSGPSGLAAIQICKISKATAIVVTSSKITVDLLRSSGFPPGHIILLNQEDIIIQIRRITAGCGIDVIFCHKSTDQSLILECSICMTPFGRLVMYGGKERSSSSSQGMLAATRSSSVITYDMRDLYCQKPQTLAKLLETTFKLYDEDRISVLDPITIKGLHEINEAMGLLSNELGHGKCIVSYNDNAPLKVTSSRPRLRFCPNASYLLVGCLGGLGRSLASWMIERGAKHLIFVSRSGTDNPEAAALVESIRLLGAHVQILRADITSKTQLQRAMMDINPNLPIRGVVNAAMVLQV